MWASGCNNAEYKAQDALESKLDARAHASVNEVDAEEDCGLVVLVRVGPCLFTISVGDGAQTVKWLSLVAAQRYAAHVQAHGKQRQREEALLNLGNYIPVAVRCETAVVDASLSVQEAIATYCAASGNDEEKFDPEFEVELCLQVNLGEDGAPEYKEWQASAFCHSSAGKQHARRQRAKLGLGDDSGGAADERTEDDLAYDPRDNMSGKHLPPGLHTLFDGPERVAFEMERDWRNLRKCVDFKSWFADPRVGGIDEDKEEEARTAFLNAFEDLCHMIDYYTWTSRRNDPFALTTEECKHLVHHSALADLRESPTLVEDALRRARLGVRDADPTKDLVHRYEVMAIILSVAASQFSSSVPVMLNELQRLLDDHVSTPATSLRSADRSDPTRAPLWQQSVARAFRSKRSLDREPAKRLAEMFSRACIQSQVRGAAPCMSLQEFMLWCDDALSEDIRRAWAAGSNHLEGSSSSSSEAESKRRETKLGGAADPVDRLDRCKAVFESAQRAFPSKTSAPLTGLVLSDFLLAVLIILRHSEVDEDAWKSGSGAQNLLDLLESSR